MFKRLHRVLFIALAGSLLAGCSAAPSSSELPTANNHPAQPVPILQTMMGNDSQIQAPGVTRITSKHQLDALGITPAVNVNFDKQTLVLAALGKQPTTGYWVKITGVSQVGNKLYVQGLANKPAKDQQTAKHVTYPYCLVLIPKTSATDLASDIQSVVGQAIPKDKDASGDEDSQSKGEMGSD